jgi:hypothetical protein
MKDINGNTHNLYSILDSGKTVILDFFGVLCTPCWLYHQGGVLEQAYNKWGPAGENRLRVFMIECQQSADSQIKGKPPTKGDWTDGTPFPIIHTHLPNIPNIIDFYSGGGLPTYYMICPDKRTISLRPSITDTNLIKFYMDFCPLEPHDSLTLRTYKLDSIKSLSCSNNLSPVLSVQNYGIDSITNIKTITYFNNIAKDTLSFNVHLKKWGVTQLNYNYSDMADSSYRIEIKTYKLNDKANFIKDSINNRFTISLNSGYLPFSETFTNPDFPYNRWQLVQVDVNYPSWEWVDLSYCKSLIIPFPDMPLYNEDYFVLPRFDITNVQNPLMTFEYAYAKNPDKDYDWVVISFKADCNTEWDKIVIMSSTEMSTAPDQGGSFIPEQNEWKRAYVELDEVPSGSEVFFRIKGLSHQGNNFFLRNLKIMDSSTSINEFSESFSELMVYPNPASSKINISFSPQTNSNLRCKINDLQGRTVYISDKALIKGIRCGLVIDVSALAEGLYFIELSDEKSVAVKKINVIH